MRKSGFTLIELLVYMAIMGFIIVVAGRVFSDATGMRVRSQNMIKTSEQVGNVANLITEDISQTGVKTWAYSSASSYVIDTEKGVYISPADSSSFILSRGAVAVEKGACNGIIKENTDFDEIVFRKAEFENNIPKVLEIGWKVNNQCELYRRCITNGPPNSECTAEGQPVLIAKNIRKFSFYASAPGAPPKSGSSVGGLSQDTIFPIGSNTGFRLISPGGTGEAQTISANPGQNNTVASVYGSSVMNVDESGVPSGIATSHKYGELYLAPVTGSNIEHCHKVPIREGETWAVEFNMPFPSGGEISKQDSNLTQFLPGKDHIAVGLRYSDETSTGDRFSNDVLFYPPQDNAADHSVRYAEFFAKADPAGGKEVCVALTLSFYSPLASEGIYHFSNFKVYRKPTGAYHFVKKESGYPEDFAREYATEVDANKLNHKKNVKAFELLLEIDQNGEIAGTYSQGNANAGIAISVPNNGGT
ncbi:MAG: type II secretion system GspH family protein [Candidatus Fibromonas sp.]|jgi:prepilin-type N-terminal cleavage/methylation domain-containing protein|nr:type II secretion system GspH family protein [Candidatus Fibromonas sp.]